jgi:hypothetical protein
MKPATKGGDIMPTARHKEPEAKPKPPAKFTRRECSFYPPTWTEKLDAELFDTVSQAFEATDCGYHAICQFADKHNFTLDATQNRWHLVAIRT